MIMLTEQAGVRMKEMLKAEETPNFGLRVYVEGGGCSGYQYGMAFEEAAGEEDLVFQQQGVTLFVDPYSQPMLAGTQIDYSDDLQHAGFSIKNPNAKSTCGCGSSFST